MIDIPKYLVFFFIFRRFASRRRLQRYSTAAVLMGLFIASE